MSRPHGRHREVVQRSNSIPRPGPSYLLWKGGVEELLRQLPPQPRFDLIVTSPPYNIGKSYEIDVGLTEYLRWQGGIIDELVQRLKPTGSLCWQVGSRSENGTIDPLDYHFHPMFAARGLFFRNRIIWHFGHGLHRKFRFSGRHEVILWYSKSNDYVFNLDDVRISPKYPRKRAYRGPHIGEYSCNPRGKNPEDVWDIPNVKSMHVEKTVHPCQFPVALAERLVLALTNRRGLVFDPFCGVGSAGVAAALHGRRFWGAEIDQAYVSIARQRISAALRGEVAYRPHDKAVYDHRQSSMSLPVTRNSP